MTDLKIVEMRLDFDGAKEVSTLDVSIEGDFDDLSQIMDTLNDICDGSRDPINAA